MEALEVDHVVLRQDGVPDVGHLHLAPGLRAVVELAAVKRGGAATAPLEAVVAVRVRPHAEAVLVDLPGLSPVPIEVPGVLVAVRVHHGQEDPVDVVHEVVLVLREGLHQVVDHVDGGGGPDPLAGVDAGVDPHDRVGAALSPAADLQDDHVPTLVRLPDDLGRNKVGIFFCKIIIIIIY